MFEKIQQGDLRAEMECNEALDVFLAEQGLDEYTQVLIEKGFNKVTDLSKLKEKHIDFKMKPKDKQKLLWIVSTEKIILDQDNPQQPNKNKTSVANKKPSTSPLTINRSSNRNNTTPSVSSSTSSSSNKTKKTTATGPPKSTW